MELDRIISSAPLNGTAKRVVSKGSRFEPIRKLGDHIAQWDVCPELGEVAPNQDDLTGIKFGQFTVIGIWKGNPKKLKNSRGGRSRWVCRCSCGMFEARSRRSIVNPNNNKDCCYSCQWLENKKYHLKNRKKQ